MRGDSERAKDKGNKMPVDNGKKVERQMEHFAEMLNVHNERSDAIVGWEKDGRKENGG